MWRFLLPEPSCQPSGSNLAIFRPLAFSRRGKHPPVAYVLRKYLPKGYVEGLKMYISGNDFAAHVKLLV